MGNLGLYRSFRGFFVMELLYCFNFVHSWPIKTGTHQCLTFFQNTPGSHKSLSSFQLRVHTEEPEEHEGDQIEYENDRVELFRLRLVQDDSPLNSTPLEIYLHNIHLLVNTQINEGDEGEEYCDPFLLNSCNEEECEIPHQVKGVLSNTDSSEVMEFLGIKRAKPIQARIRGEWE